MYNQKILAYDQKKLNRLFKYKINLKNRRGNLGANKVKLEQILN
jgi:hypothetical protein